jgi:hypothetical protein
LFRLGSTKHFLFYKNAEEISNNIGLHIKKAKLLASQGLFTDRSSWLEEFFCSQHGNLWLVIQTNAKGYLTTRFAEANDWKKTTGTIDPTIANPSVSEFTYRMSRQTHGQLRRFYNH